MLTIFAICLVHPLDDPMQEELGGAALRCRVYRNAILRWSPISSSACWWHLPLILLGMVAATIIFGGFTIIQAAAYCWF